MPDQLVTLLLVIGIAIALISAVRAVHRSWGRPPGRMRSGLGSAGEFYNNIHGLGSVDSRDKSSALVAEQDDDPEDPRLRKF